MVYILENMLLYLLTIININYCIIIPIFEYYIIIFIYHILRIAYFCVEFVYVLCDLSLVFVAFSFCVFKVILLDSYSQTLKTKQKSNVTTVCRK